LAARGISDFLLTGLWHNFGPLTNPMGRISYLAVFLVCFGVIPSFAQDIFAPMKDAIKTGNAKEVIKFFNSSVDMNLDGEVAMYSKAQAEFVLRDFFKKHPSSDFSIVHTGSSKGGLQFAIGRYVSNADTFDVVIRVKEVGGTYLIHEINFVKD
ncbi:MAG TPA: DUF4783 domain-containing protein, partial [Cyclobacteriaceae bacterium]